MPRSRTILQLAYAFALLTATPLIAHPMGNFSVNHYSRIWVGTDSVQLRYVVDLAEIPTFQELQARNIKTDLSGPDLSAYLQVKAEEFARGIKLSIDGRPVRLACGEGRVIFPPGAGGLPTMKFGFTCNVALSRLNSGQHSLEYRDENFPGRAGWKELIVRGDAASHLVSAADREDRSGELSNYPTDLLNSPPQDLVASISFTTAAVPSSRRVVVRSPNVLTNNEVGRGKLHSVAPTEASSSEVERRDTAVSSLKANAQLTPRSRFTELIRQPRLSLWFLVTAALISMALGALHALEPGHGKTLVAAYLVGSRGTATHAVLLGLIVTLAHTAGVYVLGAVTLYASRYVLPEKLYPWLGAVSGTIIASLGVLLFVRRWSGADKLLGEGHTHWYERFGGVNSDEKISEAQATSSARQVSIRQLLVLGVVGGLVPCPAALVVLLSAFALHRVAFGFFLILSFSFGLAAVLIGIGLVMVHAGRLAPRLNADSQLVRRLPLLSAAAITVVGLALVFQSAKNGGMMSELSAVAGAKWLLVGGIGLLLGMRHSTDADHVIAVTTIVTRLRTVRHASIVGMLWGIGHTLTIFIVGSAIILFGIVIPPRIGLSMEFAVALMLVLLGVLNLTGVLARLTRRFSPKNSPDHTLLAKTHARMEWAGAGSMARSLESYQLFKPLVIGIVHGLAGSAAVALLVLATIHEPVWAIGYLLLFGLGTIAGMMLMTAIIAVPIVWTGNGFARWNRLMTATSGIVSVAFGLFLIYRIGFVSGLFSSGPKWIPG